jgi:hypothetical protein
MQRALVVGLAFALLAPAQAGVDPEIHNICKDSKDYSGCVQTHTVGIQVPTKMSEECWKDDDNNRLCVASEGEDRFGLPKKEGWIYWTDINGNVSYFEWDGKRRRANGWPKSVDYKIIHKGETRYIGRNVLFRYMQDPTPSRSATIGSANTYCSGTGAYLSCNTTPAPTITIPGSTGGAISERYLYVFDCKESTWVYYNEKGKPSGKWIKDTSSHPSCKEINELPVLEYKL